MVIPLPGSERLATKVQIHMDGLQWQLPPPQQIATVDADGRLVSETQVPGEHRLPAAPGLIAFRLR